MLGIGTALAGIGVEFVKDLIMDNGEDLVKEGIKKVTGIDLNKKEVKDLTPEEIVKIKESELAIRNIDYEIIKLTMNDRLDARSRDINLMPSKDWMVRNTGSILAIFTVLTAFRPDNVACNSGKSSAADISPSLTFIIKRLFFS